MYKIIVLILLTIISAEANSLQLISGQINAHTEVFGDRKINPNTKDIKSKLTIEESINSIKGEINIKSISLSSNNKDRDEEMYKTLNVKVNKDISFNVINITKKKKKYVINGTLTLNAIQKELTSKVLIEDKNNQLTLNGKFSIYLTDFDMKPPTLLFLTVRNKIDITYALIYSKEK